MGRHDMSEAYRRALTNGFAFADELGRRCGPVHLLVGIAESEAPGTAGLSGGGGPSLREVVTANNDAFGHSNAYLLGQAQRAARVLAERMREVLSPAHLLVALLDQRTPEVAELLALAGLDPSGLRAGGLAAIGAPADLPSVPLPPLAPAGTFDRPPLPVAELDTRAWSALCWRQGHLPLSRLRRRNDWGSLYHLEHRAAWRLADKLGLDDDQRYSLHRHHLDEVQRRAAEGRPRLVEPVGPRPYQGTIVRPILACRPTRRWQRRPRFLNFTVGWGTWLQNRRVGMRDRWFRLRTSRAYRGAPRLS
ncbi:MAG: Clp protease N-terminal domain-containing protein [Acidimicrobiales bacterium]